MRSNRRLIYAAMALLLILLLSTVLTPFRPKIAQGATMSRGECVMEVAGRHILYEHDAEKKLPMASTTKILTAVIIIEECNLAEEITIPQEAEGTEGSSVYLKAGERYSVEDLLYGLMLQSGNDCAVTLALHHSGSTEAFAQRMNERARRMGAYNSHFVNPHGLPDREHYTTARDLALIAAYAMENETFRNIVSTKYYARHNWKNKNKMLWSFAGANGIKTGFTVEAGRCLVSGACKEGHQLVCVVLYSPQMYERSQELLECAFSDLAADLP